MNAKTTLYVLSAICAILALCGRTATAATFPDVDSSHDISSTTAWGGDIPAAAEFDSEATTYGAGQDVRFGSVKVMAGTNVFDFSSTPGRTVTVTNKGYYAFWLEGSNSSLELKGGKWDMGSSCAHSNNARPSVIG